MMAVITAKNFSGSRTAKRTFSPALVQTLMGKFITNDLLIFVCVV